MHACHPYNSVTLLLHIIYVFYVVVVRTTLNVQPVKCERKYRKKNAVVDEDFEPDDSLESSEKDSSDVEASKEKSEKIVS